MSLPRFFLEDQVLSAVITDVFALKLSDDDRHHFDVLRLSSGESIAVIDGSSDYFICRIVEVRPDEVMVSIAERPSPVEQRPHVTLFQALPKQGKFDEVVRHGTEIGIDGFQPFISKRCVTKLDETKGTKRVQRWGQIAKNAAMQSGRTHIPKVTPIATFEGVRDMLSSFDGILLFWEEAPSGASIAEALSSCGVSSGDGEARVAVIIGSEGGFEESEVDALLSVGPQTRSLSLGNTILRTETAGVIASALVIYELGGLR